MTAAITTAPRFDMGRVVSRTFGAIGQNWLVFGLLALLLASAPQAAVGFARVAMSGSLISGVATTFSWQAFGLAIGAGLVGLLSSCVLQAALTHGTVSYLNGRPASFGDCLSTGVRLLFPVLGIGILLGLALVFGLILLIVPGVLMGLAWIVTVPVEVIERRGVLNAFGRSADLTRNHRGAIFGLSVAYWVVVWALSAALAGLSFGALLHPNGVLAIVAVVVSALLQGAIGLLGSAGIAAIYYELRSIKEGIGPEELAAVFD